MIYWKIKNKTKGNVKIGVALSSTSAPGVILQEGQFCLSLPKMTSSLDMQSKRGFVEIDKSFSNDLKLDLGKPINESEIVEIQKKVENYGK
jgi:hypothetical protein